MIVEMLVGFIAFLGVLSIILVLGLLYQSISGEESLLKSIIIVVWSSLLTSASLVLFYEIGRSVIG